MAISRFDEGTLAGALVGYWSAAESVITDTAGVVSQVAPVADGYPAAWNLLLDAGSTTDIRTGATIGAMAALEDNLQGTPECSMKIDTTDAIPDVSNGFSIVTVFQPQTNSSHPPFGIRRADGSLRLNWLIISDAWRLTLQSVISSQVSRAENADPNIHVLSFNGDATGDVRIKDGIGSAEYPFNDVGAPNNTEFNDYYVMGSGGNSGSTSVRGSWALYALYNRALTAQERIDLEELCQYWIDNGEAPGESGPPTTVTFGPVTTNDDPSVTGWSWEASADGGANWDEAENVLSDVTGEATPSLVVNSATLSEDQTQVRCRATSGKEPGGVVSAVATLTVQAAS